MIRLKRIVVFTFIAILGLAPVAFIQSCTHHEPEPLRVGTNIWPGYEPLYLARELGLYSGKEIRLLEYTSSSEVIRAYRNRSIEAAALTLDEVLLLKEHKQDPKIVLIMDYSNGGDVILGRGGLDSLEKIKGRRVAVESNALGAFMLSRALDFASLGPEDITIVNSEVNEHEEIFHSGKVDAVVTFEPVKTRLVAKGAKILFDSSRIPSEIVDVLVVREEYLQKHAMHVNALITGWFQALERIRTHPKESMEILARREGISPDQFEIALSGLHLPAYEDNLKALSGQDNRFQTGLERLTQVMISRNLVGGDISGAGLVDIGPLKSVK